MTEYEIAREEKIKEKGAKWVRNGEAYYDKHQEQPLVKVWDDVQGSAVSFKKDVAERFINSKKTHSNQKSVFSVPALPWKDN